MKSISGIIFLIFWVMCNVFADTTNVTGKVYNGKGLTIRLMTFKDHVSYLRHTLDISRISEDGRFKLSFDAAETRYAWIDIEFQQADLFLQPGQHYEIEIELSDQAISTSYYDRLGLPMKIIRDDTSRLNLYIQDFNRLYNDFLLNYTDNIRSRGSAGSFEVFRKAIDLRFQNATHSYFLDYVRYKNASMQLFLRLKSREKIGMEYFAGPILYENIEYMDFFNLYFEKYFLTGSKYFNYNKTYDLINGEIPLSVILDSLKSDPVLYQAELRELLLLSGLKELYNTTGFKRSRISYLVEEMSVKSSSSEIRQIADNLKVSFSRLQPGTSAPGFYLTDLSGEKKYRLDDFKGKNIYLVFFESGNPACQAELEMIPDLHNQYGSKVYFLAVSVDKDRAQLDQYIKSRDFPWLVLHFGGDLTLLENYDASTFPHFVLIDDNGNVLRCPAASPSEDIRKVFDSF